jgi:hypothetical protein
MPKLLQAALFGTAIFAVFTFNLSIGRADGVATADRVDEAELDSRLPPALCHTVHGRQVCDYLVRCQPAQVIDQSGVARLIYADIGCAQERARLGE